MTRIVIVLTGDGMLDTVLADSEADIRVLRESEDDREIDVAKAELGEVTLDER